MFYAILDDGIRKIDKTQFLKKPVGICILTLDEWHMEAEWRERFGLWHEVDSLHYCKMESYHDFLFGTICVPAKGSREKEMGFAIFVQKERVILLDRDGKLGEQVSRLSKGKRRKDYSLERFVCDFLQSFLADDLLFLEKIDQEIAGIEEDVLEGRTEDYSYRMLQTKKLIARFYHYYSQLAEIGQEILENQQKFFNDEELNAFRMYSDRVFRLSEETKLLREYAMQVQEVYQSEIGIRQNDVMKILTVVTTIFLPLSLIAGWYGMNFAGMPELLWRHGYAFVWILSILVVLLCVWYFKKKDLF